MNMLYLNFSMGMGGIERIICDMSTFFKQKGMVVQVGVFQSGGELELELSQLDIGLVDFNKSDGIDFRLIARLRHFIKDKDISLIHTNNYSAWMYAVLSSLLLPSVRIVHTEHSLVSEHHIRRFILERFLAMGTDTVVAVSDDIKQALINKAYFPSSSIEVIKNGVDVQKFKPNPLMRNSLRKLWCIDDDCIVFGTVGRIVEVKDHRTLIMAFYESLKYLKSAKLILVGDGLESEALSELINELQLQDHVIMLGSRNDAAEILSTFDIYICSSKSEGLSVSILEAMATGLPIIATAVGGNLELVESHSNGLLVAVSNALEMSKAMLLLSDNALMRAEMGHESRTCALNNLSIEKQMAGYQALYYG